MHSDKRANIQRIIIAAASILIAVLAFIKARDLDYGIGYADLLLNLGSEILGIGITVAIVDYLFDKTEETRKVSKEAHAIAFRALHRLDHAVWVWQGGNRDLELGELSSLLLAVKETDPITEFTEAFLLRLGSAARETLDISPDVVKATPKLEKALTTLKPLLSVRDSYEHRNPKKIAGILYESAGLLANVLGLEFPTGQVETVQTIRDCSIEAQERREFGLGHPEKFDPSKIEIASEQPADASLPRKAV
jgi:hypothetical protein